MKDDDEANKLSSEELLAVVPALLDALNDKDATVQQSAIESIRKISQKKPIVVIQAAVYFWELHKKISEVHLVAVLKMMADICDDNVDLLTDSLATSVADLAIMEITGHACEQACDLLVALCKKKCSPAIGSLIVQFQPNVTPHHTIIRVIGMIATNNAIDMLPFIKLILSILVPLMPVMIEEPIKISTTYTLARLADAIYDCLTNTEIETTTGLTKDFYQNELLSAFELLTSSWLKSSRNLNLTENIMISLASILPLLPKTDENHIFKLIPVALNLCKKPQIKLSASRLLALILSNATNDDKETLRLHLEQIHYVLIEMVSIAPFEAARRVLLAHFEVLQCFRAIVIRFPEEGLERILQQLKSQNTTQRSRALVILKHLINTLLQKDDSILQKIATSLQDSLGEGSTRHLVGAMVALAARPTFPLLPSQRTSFIKFIILHCGSKAEEAEACEEALHLLSSTVEGAETWLWPVLLKALLDQTFAASVCSILRALSPLAVKIINDEDSSKNEKDFQSIKVLSRCLEFLDEEKNRAPIITFLRCAAPLFGDQLKLQWEAKLAELSKFLEQGEDAMTAPERTHIWEARLVEFLEESASCEDPGWAAELADELSGKTVTPSVAICLSAIASNPGHVAQLIELARTHSVTATGRSPVADEYARAVGVCAKRHLAVVLKLMEEACAVEDARKQPSRLLGLVKDTRAAATNEAAKAGLLKAYAEIASKAEAAALFAALDKNIFSWIVRQLNECKELSTKEAGLLALEKGGEAVHPKRLAGSTGFRNRGTALATLLGLFQSSSGYRPLQLYPLILKAIISLLKVPPPLTAEEKQVLLESSMDKVIGASMEIDSLKMPQVMQQVIEGLGVISSETVSDSADTLALLVDILLPWMQSKSVAERKTTLIILRMTLRSYHDSLKYTYPGGKLEPGKLIGRFLAWSADSDLTLRPLVVDCIALALKIGARHRSAVPDNNLNNDLSESKQIIVSEDAKSLYKGVQSLAMAACARVASGEVVSLAEGLIEGLLYRGEGGVAAGIALSELFKLRGFDIPRSNLYLIDSIIDQMRQMENVSCKKEAAVAIKSLSPHHPQEIVEHLLQQPLPLDRGTKECWKELGSSLETGSESLKLLLMKLQNENLLVDTANVDSGKRSTAAFVPLASVVAIGHLLSSSTAETLIDRQLAELLGMLLKYLAGWLHVDPPMSIVSTKFGFVPNRESCKIIPHREVYAVLSKILKVIGIHILESTSIEGNFESESEAEENLVGTVNVVVQCLTKRNNVLVNLGRCVGKLVTSSLASQRAVAVSFYAELIGKAKCDDIWLDSIINTLHEAKSDSSALVRKLATIGLTRVAYLEAKHVEEYFDNCLGALLEGLEEPSSAEGSSEVILESLRGLSVLLEVKTVKPVSPRVVLSLKPFVEKENWEIRLASIRALGAAARGWQRFVESPDDDITDHLLGCVPTLAIKLEDGVENVVEASREVLHDSAFLLQCKSLSDTIQAHLSPECTLKVENFFKDLIECLKADLPERAEELRNSVVRGYSRSENGITRATSALILGLFGEPRPEDVQRLLQLLKDPENFVRARAARGLSLCFTV